ncbi:hypothetical protein DMJ13_14595 [halophilic archaeon]|nr:hypothetical protein DMJ13_14595 [halophilic archaeon]
MLDRNRTSLKSGTHRRVSLRSVSRYQIVRGLYAAGAGLCAISVVLFLVSIPIALPKGHPLSILLQNGIAAGVPGLMLVLAGVFFANLPRKLQSGTHL